MDMARKFYTLDEIAESLAISMSQMRALIKRGDIEGIQIGGRGQWRVEDVKLDEYIDRMYEEQQSQRGSRTHLDT